MAENKLPPFLLLKCGDTLSVREFPNDKLNETPPGTKSEAALARFHTMEAARAHGDLFVRTRNARWAK